MDIEHAEEVAEEHRSDIARGVKQDSSSLAIVMLVDAYRQEKGKSAKLTESAAHWEMEADEWKRRAEAQEKVVKAARNHLGRIDKEGIILPTLATAEALRKALSELEGAREARRSE